MTVFAPPYAPSKAGSSSVTKARAVSAQFGDGYEQRARDGLNTQARNATWVWNPLKRSDYDAIIAVFQAAGGVDPLSWTPPGEAAGKFKVPDWTTTYPGGSARGISATFIEVFDL